MDICYASCEKTKRTRIQVEYSGSSLESALSKSDAEATADFDTAVKNLTDLKAVFDELKAKRDYGVGSFSLTYVVRVKRDVIIKDSNPVVFEYKYNQ